MKKIIDAFTMMVFTIAAIYFVVSFVAWDWNPLNWSLLGRFIAVALMIIIEGFAVLSSDE